MIISLPDVNVRIALAAEGHVHHLPARDWFTAQSNASVAFCRITQMGLLRLLTNSKVMGGAPFLKAQVVLGFLGGADFIHSDEEVEAVHQTDVQEAKQMSWTLEDIEIRDFRKLGRDSRRKIAQHNLYVRLSRSCVGCRG